MNRLLVLSAVLLCAGAGAQADDADDKAAKLVADLGGKCSRNEKQPGKPLTSINFKFCKGVTDAELRTLVPLVPNLTSLDLVGTKVTDAGLQELAPLKRLNRLELYLPTDKTVVALKEVGLLHAIPQADGATLERPTKADEVVRLAIRSDNFGDSITPAGLKEFAIFKNLEVIDCPGHVEWLATLREMGLLHTMCYATDKDGKRVKKAEDVTHLIKGGNHLTDTGMKELTPLKNLTHLTLDCGRLTDNAMRTVAGFTELTHLDLHGESWVTNAGLKHLAPLKKLDTLVLPYTLNLTDETLAVLAKNGHLHALTAATDAKGKRPATADDVASFDTSRYSITSEVTGKGLKHLTAFKNLTALTLKTEITDAGLKELAAFLKLASVQIESSKMTDAGMKELAACKTLTAVALEMTRVTDAGLKELTALEDLATLSFTFGKVTDEGMKELVKLKKLSHLSLVHTDVKPAGLKEVAKLKGLKTFHYKSGFLDGQETALAELNAALPECKINPEESPSPPARGPDR